MPHQGWAKVQDHLPHLLAVLFLKHHRIPWPQGPCCLTVTFLSTVTPKSFSLGLFSRRSVSTLSWCLQLFILRCRTLHLLCWTSLSPPLPISLACWSLSEGAAQLSGMSAASPNFVSPENLPRRHSLYLCFKTPVVLQGVNTVSILNFFSIQYFFYSPAFFIK